MTLAQDTSTARAAVLVRSGPWFCADRTSDERSADAVGKAETRRVGVALLPPLRRASASDCNQTFAISGVAVELVGLSIAFELVSLPFFFGELSRNSLSRPLARPLDFQRLLLGQKELLLPQVEERVHECRAVHDCSDFDSVCLM